MAALKDYQINKAGETTTGGHTLPTGFVISIEIARRMPTTFALKAFTCEAPGGVPLTENETNLAGTELEFDYNPAQDNSKTLNSLLATHFESLLDTWFGAGNWVGL